MHYIIKYLYDVTHKTRPTRSRHLLVGEKKLLEWVSAFSIACEIPMASVGTVKFLLCLILWLWNCNFLPHCQGSFLSSFYNIYITFFLHYSLSFFIIYVLVYFCIWISFVWWLWQVYVFLVAILVWICKCSM